uniref:Coiled-coil alpha-helical rod protein 1 n=1 Tax=Chrysemys picta bellii TaxID=8478 RepID=A0A8C3HSZ8_CHRPI
MSCTDGQQRAPGHPGGGQEWKRRSLEPGPGKRPYPIPHPPEPASLSPALQQQDRSQSPRGEKPHVHLSLPCRSLDREAEPPAARHTLAISQQAELISHQLHEIQRLEAELAGLRAAALQQEATVAARESTMACLQGELEQLRGRSQAEGEALRAELEEQKRRGQTEVTALKAELEELRRRGQAETNALRAELEEQRRRGQAEADALRAELEVAAEQHQQELAVARGELQAALEEGKAQTQRATERLQGALGEHQAEVSGGLGARTDPQLGALTPSPHPQRLEGERDALRTTAELLQLRLASLSDILALQELELTRKVTPCDPLQPETAQKSQSLLSRWREKVFALMVQLRSQELGHVDATNLLQRKVRACWRGAGSSAGSPDSWVLYWGNSAPKNSGGAGSQDSWVLSLALGGEWGPVVRARGAGSQDSCRGLSDSLIPPFPSSPSLEALRAELALLHQERDHLVAELKKGAQILEQQVAEAREKGTWAGLSSTVPPVAQVKPHPTVFPHRWLGCGPYWPQLEVQGGALQEKVTEVETRLRQDLSELEQRLSEARREQTKAVVALRQAERQAARDRARSQELARLQEEAKREETGRLGTRLQALERDKNLLMATLRQEGLLAQYKQNRLSFHGPLPVPSLPAPPPTWAPPLSAPPLPESFSGPLAPPPHLGPAPLSPSPGPLPSQFLPCQPYPRPLPAPHLSSAPFLSAPPPPGPMRMRAHLTARHSLRRSRSGPAPLLSTSANQESPAGPLPT